jgi:hypothetical protein
VTKEPPHVLREGFEFPGVAAVSEDDEQVQEAVAKQAQQQLCAIKILHAGWRYHYAQEQAVGVGERMTLASLDLFSAS